MSKTLRLRQAFTLIELLVVIAIIATLTAATAAGVMTVRKTAYRTKVANDIGQLDTQCKNFKGAYGFFPPSRLKLSTNAADYTTPALLETTTYLTMLCPRIDFGQFAASVKSIRGGTDGVEDLQGDQCLVLFLGGPPANGTVVGLSKNPRNPFDLSDLDPRNRSKLFDFQPARLASVGGSAFPAYTDAWERNVYAYFSSGRARYNGVAPYDCSRLGITNGPYFTSSGPPIVYVNPQSCQIISAGADGQFGSGGSTSAAPTSAGLDDQNNSPTGG